MKRALSFVAGVVAILGIAIPVIVYFVWFPRLNPGNPEKLAPVEVITPRGVAEGIVFYLSGADGYSIWDSITARRLATEGNIVVGIDTPETLRKGVRTQEDCVYFVSDIEKMSHDIQRTLASPRYHSPVIAGAGLGGTFALGLAAQTPYATVLRTVVVDPLRVLPIDKKLCSRAPYVKSDDGKGLIYGLQPGALPDPIDVYTSSTADPDGLTHVDELRTAGFEIGQHATQLSAAGTLRSAIARATDGLSREGDALAKLPLTILAAEAKYETMAIFFSGDGGWRDIDAQIGAALKEAGVPVIGVDSLRYFWNEVQPHDAAFDVNAIITAYKKKWHVSKVALIGYSFGADVLPAIYDALPTKSKPSVSLLSMLGYSGARQFEIQVADIITQSAGKAESTTLSELRKIPASIVQCVYGREDEENLCHKIGMSGVELVERPGGHHFDNRYAPIAAAILKRLSAG
ncbi:AcvB/VirJ family lysyl-phosphatidylglycerol hydrolase [Pleomorphomonas oryzae]|uniref:AcvB/VirJ family lysyl-phosphatidylglycerol hydrolase n=1 Tax=Pleomorphomonas oryzae TaxID=261934 RepID=UPI0003FCB737|nr:AcvB/VirJ family lysyl-phosphatidylglycerol hydrolase [Pleomorphomonas oryzae]